MIGVGAIRIADFVIPEKAVARWATGEASPTGDGADADAAEGAAAEAGRCGWDFHCYRAVRDQASISHFRPSGLSLMHKAHDNLDPESHPSMHERFRV